MRHYNRIFFAGLALRVPEALRIAFLVAELQRVGRRLGKFDSGMAAPIEQHRQALLGRNPEMVPAMRADMQVRLEIAMKDHLAAVRAFVPEVVRHVLFLRSEEHTSELQSLMRISY